MDKLLSKSFKIEKNFILTLHLKLSRNLKILQLQNETELHLVVNRKKMKKNKQRFELNEDSSNPSLFLMIFTKRYIFLL